MAVRTVSQTGPISLSSTFGGSAFSNGDSIVNPAGNGFTLTVDANATVAGFSGTGGNGATTVAAGVTLTITAGVTQGNAAFTLSAGASLVADTSGGNFAFLLGTANSQHSCYFVATGSVGSRCSVSVTGGGYFYFGGYEENGNFLNCGGYVCDYTDFTHVGNAAGNCAFRESTFGSHDVIFRNCTFDDCADTVRESFGWGGTDNKSFIVSDCRFANERGGGLRIVADGTTGSGTKSVARVSVEGTPTFSPKGFAVTDVYFDNFANLNFAPASFQYVVFRTTAASQEPGINSTGGLADWYFLADLGAGPLNPHFCGFNTPNKTLERLVFELFSSVAGNADGDCLFGALGTGTVKNCLVLPDRFGWASGCFLNPEDPTSWAVNVYHNTNYGKRGQLIFSENAQGVDFNAFANLKSNLVESPSASSGEKSWVVEDQYAPTPGTTRDDIANPAQTTLNATYHGDTFTDPVTAANYTGFRCLFSSAPTGNLILGASAGFVAPTRNFAEFAVYKGWASSGDTDRQKTDAGRAQFKLNPALVRELIPWVMAGFAPTNATLQNAGHDSVTIGAVEFVATVLLPTPVRPTRQTRNRTLLRI